MGVAVSGGADSVALLRLFVELREELGVVACVVHFNHKLRGKHSDLDEKFVAKLAAKLGSEFFVAREDVALVASRERANLEDAARRARYSFFQRLVQEGHVTRIAVAHTADDQAETVLAHILRGTGLAGLGGIHPRTGVIFRPLLEFRRAHLRSYLRAKRQSWREDASNRDTRRTRAHIRKKLLPLLEKQFQSKVVEHLCQLADLAREDEAYLQGLAERWALRSLERSENRARILLAEFLAEPRPLRTRLIRQLVQSIKPSGGQLSAPHVEAVLLLASGSDAGKSLQLPGGVEVRRDQSGLIFQRLAETPQKLASRPPPNDYSYNVNLRAREAELHIVELPALLHLRVIDWPPEGRETKVQGAVLDRDGLRLPLVVRNWRPGDVMRPLGHRKQHKLARLLNEIGVNRWEKARWPVLTCGGKLVWVRGLPVAAEFAANESTREGVMITEERES